MSRIVPALEEEKAFFKFFLEAIKTIRKKLNNSHKIKYELLNRKKEKTIRMRKSSFKDEKFDIEINIWQNLTKFAFSDIIKFINHYQNESK